jgi:hypothetical protein
MNIYIACGLTHVPRDEFSEYVAFINGLAAYLSSSNGRHVKYALRDSDPQLAEKSFDDRARLCYLWDKEMVEWADVVVAEASYPSTGLGIELQIADATETPIVLAFRRVEAHRARAIQYETPDRSLHQLQLGDGYVSLMALGLPSIFKVQPYRFAEDAYVSITESIELLVRISEAG